MKLSTRLTFAMVALVLLAVTTIGVVTYLSVAKVALPRTLDRLEVHTRLLALELRFSQRDAQAFVRGAAASGSLAAIVSARAAGGVNSAESMNEMVLRERIAQRYLADVRSRPDYFEISFIGVEDGGRELVRVERTALDLEPRIVPDAGLIRQSGQDYFQQTIGLPAGEVYVSPIVLDRSNPDTKMPRIPLLRVVTPVRAPDGRPFGIVVVTIDMRAALARVRSSALAGTRVFVVDAQGDYLAHPDSAKALDFALDKPARIQDEIPEFTQVLLAGVGGPRVMQDRTGSRVGAGWSTIQIAGGPRITVIETMPYRLLMAAATSVRDVGLFAGSVAVLVAILLAVLLARSLTKPLVRVTDAVMAFGRDETIPVPTDANGEIGVLARAFASMAAHVRDNTAALRKEIGERQVAEEKFRLAVEGAPSGQIMIGGDGAIVLVNAEVERLFGYGREELIGHPVEMLLPSELGAGHREHRVQFASQPKARRMGTGGDLFGVRKDGTRFQVEIGLTPINTSNGQFVLGQIVDISERKRAEAELRQYAEREQLFIAAVESSDDAIVTKTLDGRITGWNAGAARLFGYDASEAIGQSIDIIVPVELRADVRVILDRIARGEKIEHRETVRTSKDGQRIDVSLSISPVKSVSGMIIGAAKVARDITGKNKARQELLESEEMGRGIIAYALDAFVQMDEHSRILEWNPQAEATFGWTRQEALGKLAKDLMLSTIEDPHFPDLIARLVRGDDSTIAGERYETEGVRKDGQSIKVEVSMTAFRRRSGCVLNAFVRDLTERNAAEDKLRQAQKMEAVGQLTGGIAHDFNNMLTVITGTIDILADGVADKPRLAAIAKLISEAVDRGAELTSHLLMFARKQPLQPKDTDINALMADTEKLLRSALGAQIEIKQRLEPHAWRALIDPTQLTTAILNLSVNARDAMPEGGKLTLETDNVVLDEGYVGSNGDVQAGDYVMIAVSDTGTGIPDDILERVFEPFFSTKEVGKGTGLGLSMVYGFVKQSGGHVKVYSEVGHGTTIKLYLPRGTASENLPLVPEHTGRIEGGKEIILIVEDDKMVLGYVTTQIKDLGYTPLSAANAAEALALIDDGVHFDLLFTDVMMPGLMNGRQLAEEAAKRRSPLRVLFTSGYTENAMIHHGRLESGVLLLTKPYRRSELARMIRLALEAAPPSWRRPGLPDVAA
jgi:PAS domain S-box-containing protein